MNKILIFLFFSSILIANGGMNGVTHYAYFDYDNKKDKVVCTNMDSQGQYKCTIFLATGSKKTIDVNSTKCNGFSIEGEKAKGYVHIECGTGYMEAKHSIYKYNSKYKNWQIEKEEYIKSPKSPEDPGDYKIVYPAIKWNIDQDAIACEQYDLDNDGINDKVLIDNTTFKSVVLFGNGIKKEFTYPEIWDRSKFCVNRVK